MTAARPDQHPDVSGPAQDGDQGDSRQFWEDHYRSRPPVLTGGANPLLVEVVGPLAPGTALDLGSGEGGDALWLAGRGWRVTAVDVAAAALARAADRAGAAGLADRITFEQHDLSRSLPGGRYDLVSAQYLHSPVVFDREQALRSAAAAVAVGGLLLVVDHASVPPWSWADPDTRFPTPEQALASLRLPETHWHVERLDAPTRFATGPGGVRATVTDNVLAVRRLP